MSSPNLRSAAPQSGQVQREGACTIVSRGRCSGKLRGVRRNAVTRFFGSAWVGSASGEVVAVT
jgi:hypothetical protein